MLDIERLLTSLGIEFRSAGEDNYASICINPAHKETKPSMQIHKKLGIVHCFGCDLTGNIFTLLAYKGIFGADALLYLRKFPSQGYTEEELTRRLEDYISIRDDNTNSVSKNVVYDDIELPAHRLIESSAYLERRGVTGEDICAWNMAVVTDQKNLGWILVPIYQDGKLCNYFMRNPYSDGKLYGKYSRKHILAGLDFCTDYNKLICVSEGIFDAISVSHAGFQSVASLSNKLLKPQLEKLKKFREIAIVPDNDLMGLKLVESASALSPTHPVWVFQLPSNRKDAGDCTVSEIMQAYENRIPWNRYLIKKKFT